MTFVINKNPLMYMPSPRPVQGPRGVTVRDLWPMIQGGPYHYKGGMGDTEYTPQQLTGMSNQSVTTMNSIYYSTPTAAGVTKMQNVLLNLNAGQGNQVFTVQADGSLKATGLTTGGFTIGMINHLHAIMRDYISRFVARAAGKPFPTPATFPTVSTTVLNTSGLQLLSAGQIASYDAQIKLRVLPVTPPTVVQPPTTNVVQVTVTPATTTTNVVTADDAGTGTTNVVTPPAVGITYTDQIMTEAKKIQALAIQAHSLNSAYRLTYGGGIDIARTDLQPYLDWVYTHVKVMWGVVEGLLKQVISAAQPATGSGTTNVVPATGADTSTTNVTTPAATGSGTTNVVPATAAATSAVTGFDWKKWIPYLLGGGVGLYLLLGAE